MALVFQVNALDLVPAVIVGISVCVLAVYDFLYLLVEAVVPVFSRLVGYLLLREVAEAVVIIAVRLVTLRAGRGYSDRS